MWRIRGVGRRGVNKVQASRIAPNIVHALHSSGFRGAVSIHAYGNTRSRGSLLATGVDLHHVPGAQTRCMFSVLKATEKPVESQKKKKRPAFNKYADAVTSFIESYVAANQSYPKISEVVRGTGGKRSTIGRILDELNLGKNSLGCKEVCVEGLDDMKVRHTTRSVTECMPSNKESGCPYSDEFEQLAPEVVSAQVEVLTDSTDSERDTEGIGISAEYLEKKGLSDPAFLTLLGQAMHSSNKADANRRVAPLMEVLQQKSSGSSRRVHLSANRGIENELSWDKTLLSIMPTSGGGKEDTSGLTDEQPKVHRESIGQTSSSSKKSKGSFENASGLKYTVKVTTSKARSILSALSGPQLQNALKRQAEVFKDLKSLKLYPRMSNTYAHAILHFKNNESMKKALKLKTITIVGELFSLQEVSDSIMGDYTQSANLGKTSVFQEVMQGMIGSQKRKDVSSEILHSPTYSCVEDKKSDVGLQAQTVSPASFSQTITIYDCPNNIRLQSIESFFSVFGKVQTTYEKAPSKRAIFVEFENESDKEKALKVQQFTVDGCSFGIRPDASSDAVVVRLKSEQSEVNHKEVVKACKKYGLVEKVSLRRFHAMDVQFAAEERERIEELLNSLHRDEYLKGKWKVSLLCDSYVKADVFVACHKEKVENLVVLLRQLVTHLGGMLGTKLGTLNELAADIESMSTTNKIV